MEWRCRRETRPTQRFRYAFLTRISETFKFRVRRAAGEIEPNPPSRSINRVFAPSWPCHTVQSRGIQRKAKETQGILLR